jgi:hypothetical protein
MSWLYSQVLVAEYLGENYSDGEQSVPLSGNSTQLAYLPQDKMTDFSRLSRFGMMFKPLTENLGKELLMSYQAAFRAKTSQLPGQVMDLTESGQECGKRWQGLLAKYDPNTHSLRTVQCSLFEDLNQSLQTWPRWGSMQNGECFQQPMWEQTISEKEYGLLHKEIWPTPVTRDYKDTGTKEALSRAKAKRSSPGVALIIGAELGGSLNPTFSEWLMGWPLEWTDLKPLVTDKSLCVPQQLGTSLKED